MNKKRVRGNEGEYTFGDPETSNMRRLNEFDEVNFLLGNMAFRSVLSRPAWIATSNHLYEGASVCSMMN
jgi:hypothetical protein